LAKPRSEETHALAGIRRCADRRCFDWLRLIGVGSTSDGRVFPCYAGARERPAGGIGELSMRGLLLAVFVTVLAVAGVAQTALDDKVIVPGVRIGKWTLQMSLDDLDKMNGPATVYQVENADYRSPHFLFHAWSSLDFAAGAYQPRKVGWFAVGFSYALVPWRTQQGISLQSNRADVLKIYGRPSAETVPRAGRKNMIYDAIGISFEVYDTGGNITEMRIFRPGTARNIWKI